MELSKDWLEFIDCLIDQDVDFLVVGAFAMAFHSLPRATGDIDFWVRPTIENSRKVLSAISQFGAAGMGLRPDDFANQTTILIMGVPPNRIDVIAGIDGVTFDEAWASRREGDLGGAPFLLSARLNC